MGKLVVPDRVFQRGGDVCLPDNRIEQLGPVLPRRYDELIHTAAN
jgi:hypothetical protein